MFTTPCFIRKNTPELREKLEKLGYNICPCALFYDACWLDINVDTVHGIGYSDETYPLPQEEQLKRFLAENEISNTPLIDCSDNEAMFLALAALRDDTDKHQWFIYNSMDCTVENLRDFYWFKCEEDKVEDMMYWDCAYLNCTKATVEEIMEHFTMEGGAE